MIGPLAVRGLFVTGTDTGVGKTLVATAVLRQALRMGLTPIPFKPVETGCDPAAADALALWGAAQPPLQPDEVCLYPLRLPAAPVLAAAAEAITIDLDAILGRAAELATRGDFLLVEGAGGLLVPYTSNATAADLAARLGLPLLVVARTALGTINHTALTIREARRAGLAVAGLILNQTNEIPGPHEPANAHLITSLVGTTALGTFPHIAGAARQDPDALADTLAATLGPTGLERLFGPAPGR